MEIVLNPIEQRVLGALMEKAVTTPEYYPMSLNALTNACNQKSSRDPVTDYSEEQVLRAIDSLREKRLGMRMDLTGSRTPKYQHEAEDTFTLDRAERALLCVLLLRGPQTPGQLRQRTERLHPFRDLAEVQQTLTAMQQRGYQPNCLVQVLPIQPGSKEQRYIHTLGPVEIPDVPEQTFFNAQPPPSTDKLNDLQEEILSLRSELTTLRQEFEAFRSQF